MRRILILLALVPIVCACGGGGTGAGGDAFVGYLPDDEPTQAADEGPLDLPLESPAVKAILEQCVVPDIQEVLDLLDLAKGLANTGISLSDIEVSNLDIVNVTADFSADIDRDKVDELSGSIQCVDEDGRPRLPVPLRDLLDLMSGAANPFDVITRIEDGARILVVFEFAELVMVEGRLDVEWRGGWPYRADGTIEVVKDACGGTLSFEDVGYEIWDGAFPICTIDLDFRTPEGALQGTLTADGTSTAVLDFTLDGESWIFTVDLVTGALTEVE